MITGEIKNRIDAIWDTYWVGGITNPMSVLEQMTYLFFMKMIDDAQQKKEAEANILGVKIANPTFKEGLWHNPETDNDVRKDEICDPAMGSAGFIVESAKYIAENYKQELLKKDNADLSWLLLTRYAKMTMCSPSINIKRWNVRRWNMSLRSSS